MKKLSQKEREEVATKGFLEDHYVTKYYLDMRLKEQLLDFRQHLDTLMEHQMHQLQVLMEQMDERYVLRREWSASKTF